MLDALSMKRLVATLVPAVALVVFACSSGDAATPAAAEVDAGTPAAKDAGATESPVDAGSDAGAPELASGTESEPNNGAKTTEVNAMVVPGEMKGAIDPANDADIFTFSVSPGELWQWTITPEKDLAAHLAVFDTTPDNLNPPRVTFGSAGAPAVLDHFVLRSGSFAAGVRDARNVPNASGKGGPTFGYTLRGVKKTVAPVAVTFPSTKSGKLAGPGALDFYSFHASKDTAFGIVIKAERKAKPSTLDSRLSLFDVTHQTAIITNDNAGTSKDSQVGGKIPADADYLVILENEGNDPTDLSYDIVFQTTAP